jgi:glycosyltransferase involved in cell wall biosynthesis
VDVARFRLGTGAGEFYLIVSALVPYKRLDLAVSALTRLGRRVLVVGTGPEERRLRALAGPGVEFLGWRGDAEVADLYTRCRAVLFPSLEDYGIVPLEAAAAGRPTIAFGRGGARETMVSLDDTGSEAPTAVFFEEQTEEALVEAIARFEAVEGQFEPRVLRARASGFDRPLFKERLRAYIASRWATFRA